MYSQEFVGKIMTYEVKHKKTPFEIKFDEGHLCHLLGLHHFGYKRAEDVFKQLMIGEITFESLEVMNVGIYRKNKMRMDYFIFLPELLNDPKIAIYNINNGSLIKADFFFYSKKIDRYISLAIRRGTSELYYPVTFIESKSNKWERNGHVAIQDMQIKKTLV